MAKRRKEKKPMHPIARKFIDFLISVLSGVVAALIWYLIEKLLTG